MKIKRKIDFKSKRTKKHDEFHRLKKYCKEKLNRNPIGEFKKRQSY